MTPDDTNGQPPRVGPRERMALHGARRASDQDLIALLLGTGSAAEPVEVAAARLLARCGGLRGLSRLSLRELSEQPGIGPIKASRLLAALELGLRLHSQPLSRGRPLRASRDVVDALGPLLRGELREHFFAIALDAKNQTLAQLEVGVGGLLACCISPSDVFRPLLREGAASVIFAHNHPSGDPQPSEQDVAITHRLVRAGELLGISVLDHVVLAGTAHFSFLDAGLLQLRDHASVEPRP